MTQDPLTRHVLPGDVWLRDVTVDDLPLFFEYQSDPLSIHMAAFTAEDPADKAAFLAHWARILSDETITKKAIVADSHVVGHVSGFEQSGDMEVSYWIGRAFWGQGFATQALSTFLRLFKVRPLYARAVKDNAASLRVLEKCGFVVSGHNRDYANGRGEVVEEIILKLKAGKDQSSVDTDQ